MEFAQEAKFGVHDTTLTQSLKTQNSRIFILLLAWRLIFPIRLLCLIYRHIISFCKTNNILKPSDLEDYTSFNLLIKAFSRVWTNRAPPSPHYHILPNFHPSTALLSFAWAPPHLQHSWKATRAGQHLCLVTEHQSTQVHLRTFPATNILARNRKCWLGFARLFDSLARIPLSSGEKQVLDYN